MSLLQYFGQKAREAKAEVLAAHRDYREAYNSGKEVAIEVKRQLVAQGADVRQIESTLSFMRAGVSHEDLTLAAKVGYILGQLDGRFTLLEPRR